MRKTATASFPTKPTTDATITAHRRLTGCGWTSRMIDSYAATRALPRIVRMNEDASEIFHALEAVGEAAGSGRRASQKATPSGIAVVASAKLWIVSASKATLPESTTTTTWLAAV